MQRKLLLKMIFHKLLHCIEGAVESHLIKYTMLVLMDDLTVDPKLQKGKGGVVLWESTKSLSPIWAH
jgi:hypothetical protein